MSQGESKRSVLVSAAPKTNQQGIHETYTSKRDNSLMYKFWITFQNGDAGEASAKSQAKTYPVGKEVTYMKYLREYQGTWHQTFTTIKDPSAPAYSGGGGGGTSGGGGYKKSPEQQKVIINQVALIGYNSCMSKLREDGNAAYSAFKSWMYDKIFNLKEDPMTVQGVFKITCENVGNSMDNSDITKVLEKANLFLSTVKNVEWINPTQAPQQNVQPSNVNSQQQPPQQVPPQNHQQEQPSQPPMESQNPPDEPPQEPSPFMA